jgi:outer membrane protein OmpA-like peptidoglycan-associated protein
MNGKRVSGWIYFPVIFIGLTVSCFSQAEEFVKFNEPEVSNYLLPPASQGKLINNKSGEVVYYKQGDSDPVRVMLPHAKNLDGSQEASLSVKDTEFAAARTPESLDAFIAKYAPDELAFVAVQRLAQQHLDTKDWASAQAIYARYNSKFPAKATDFSIIAGILAAPVGEVVVKNLGTGINTVGDEYAPVISSNGKKLIFARDCGVCGGKEEIYVTSMNDSGAWAIGTKFGHPLESRSNEIPLALSSDGNTLAVFGNYEGTLGRGDIFHLDKTKESWGNLQHYPHPMNSEYFESNASYSPDGRAILFVSDRPGGVGDFHQKGDFFHGDLDGNTDIYVFVPDSAGSGVVMSLGSVINTPYAEYSPFLHPDGRTLYFSSNGHPGLGGLDVFKSTRLRSDSWTEWSEPVNLGKEINTSYNDWGYQFDARGDRAYFSAANRPDAFGGSDIFTVTLPGQYQPGGVVSVSGKVTDPAGNFLSADLRWNDLIVGKEAGRATSDPQNGEYVINLPAGSKYAYYAEKSGYMGQSEHLDLSEELGYREYVMDIVLYPVAKQVESEQANVVAEIRMNNVFFDFDKATLRSESRMELDRWVKMLKENPTVVLEIEGHTDNIGDTNYNQRLSEKRVKSVAQYLVEQGVASKRLETRGFGERKPIASNKTSEGRQKNRRVEVKIIR